MRYETIASMLFCRVEWVGTCSSPGKNCSSPGKNSPENVEFEILLVRILTVTNFLKFYKI